MCFIALHDSSKHVSRYRCFLFIAQRLVIACICKTRNKLSMSCKCDETHLRGFLFIVQRLVITCICNAILKHKHCKSLRCTKEQVSVCVVKRSLLWCFLVKTQINYLYNGNAWKSTRVISFLFIAKKNKLENKVHITNMFWCTTFFMHESTSLHCTKQWVLFYCNA